MSGHHKKLLKPGTIQNNKFISDIPDKRAKIEASIAFRNNALESIKRTNYQNEHDRLTGLVDLNPSLIRAKVSKAKALKNELISKTELLKRNLTVANVASIFKVEKNIKTNNKDKNIIAQRVPLLEKRLNELSTKAKLSLKGTEPHSIYKTNF